MLPSHRRRSKTSGIHSFGSPVISQSQYVARASTMQHSFGLENDDPTPSLHLEAFANQCRQLVVDGRLTHVEGTSVYQDADRGIRTTSRAPQIERPKKSTGSTWSSRLYHESHHKCA